MITTHMNSKTTYSFSAFTLIELMVVITLLAIIALTSYIPYEHHQKKVLLKQWAREISQSLSEARNFAINGLNTGWGNLNIGLYLSPGGTQIDYYVSIWPLDVTALLPADLHKTKHLPKGVQIDTITGNAEGTLFLYEAIIWDWNITQETSWVVINDIVDIIISYKGATSPVLQKTINYYTNSYISNY